MGIAAYWRDTTRSPTGEGMSEQTPWHRLFGLSLLDFFRETSVEVAWKKICRRSTSFWTWRSSARMLRHSRIGHRTGLRILRRTIS